MLMRDEDIRPAMFMMECVPQAATSDPVEVHTYRPVVLLYDRGSKH